MYAKVAQLIKRVVLKKSEILSKQHNPTHIPNLSIFFKPNKLHQKSTNMYQPELSFVSVYLQSVLLQLVHSVLSDRIDPVLVGSL